MHHKIKDGLYSVGVLNPNMRIFDVVMHTEYGTSYNSYIVKGNEKTALIEASHSTFDDAFIENIKEVCNPEDIDYIVLNHNEPDHSGALADLLNYAKNARVVLSRAGSIYIDDITNRTDFEKIVVSDGDIIDLGGKTLQFFSVPLVHWPDTMFTWLKEDRALFSCDFLGAHYCEPLMFDGKITQPLAYKQSFKEYYDAIMAPFSSAVRKGLDVVKGLNVEYACVSHGPILTKGSLLDDAIEKYTRWSEAPKKDVSKKEIAIVYASAYGNTFNAAQAIKNGIVDTFKNDGITAEATIYNVNDYKMKDLQAIINKADGFLVGSCTINRNAVPPIWELLAGVDVINSRNKPVGAFGSYGWSGEAVANLNSYMKNLTMKVLEKGYKFKFVPNTEELEKAYDFGALYASEWLKK